MKTVYYSLSVLVVVTLAFVAVPAYAQETTMTDEHITRIKSNCPAALSTLTRIHANDAPIYINRNQTYFSVSDKLMAKLNSRLTLNRFDASQLVKITSEYNVQLAKFRTVYKQYDDIMTDLLRVNCRLQPVSFYDKVAIAKIKRQKVNDSVTELKRLLDMYNTNVNTFKSVHLSESNL
ncbi:MAG: hypothetical protein WAW80_04375 [Candidatus Saccharimonadales bacterium]